MKRFVGEEVLAAGLGRDIAFADIGAERCWQALGIPAGRHHAVEIDVGERRDQIADARRTDRQTVDLLEAAGSIRIEALARLLGRRAWYGAFFLPRLTVYLPCHVRQRIDAILWTDLDLEHRFILRA